MRQASYTRWEMTENLNSKKSRLPFEMLLHFILEGEYLCYISYKCYGSLDLIYIDLRVLLQIIIGANTYCEYKGKIWGFLNSSLQEWGDRGGTVVKVLCYKSEGHWFDPSWCHWNFSLT